MKGARVSVPRFRCGGTVEDERFGGHELKVKLDPPAGLALWLKSSEVSFEGGSTPAPRPGPPAAAGPREAKLSASHGPASPAPRSSPGLAAAREQLDSIEPQERSRWRCRVGRNVVEALRFGLVPRFAIEALSVGLELERKLFDADLEKARTSGALRVLSAPYGAGKSHALDVIQQMAFRKNFAVARLELDAFECQPNQPRNIYRRLVRSLVVPGCPPTERGFAYLLDRASRSQEVLDLFARRSHRAWHEFFGPALLNWHALAGQPLALDYLYQWITGEDIDLDEMREHAAVATPRTQLLALGAYTTLSSHFTYILGGLSTLSTLLGYSGLVLMLDEAEHLRLLSVEMEGRALDFFKGLAFNALGKSLPSAYLEGCYQGGRKKFPFHWRLPSNLYVVAAVTPDPGSDELLAWVPDRSLVTPLPGRPTSREIDSFIEHAAAAYRWAFPQLEPPPPAVRGAIATSLGGALSSGALKNMRQLVQTVIGGIDLVRAQDGYDWQRVAAEIADFALGAGSRLEEPPP